jgi:predicted NUDIX family NTP pyrophosphohydrolase
MLRTRSRSVAERVAERLADRHAGPMPHQRSAGLLLYRHGDTGDPGDTGDTVLEVLLAHMGGPYWARKDHGAWTIPKGEYEPGEDPLAAARREFEEELGSAPPVVAYRDLGSVRQPGGKLVTAWAAEADFDAAGAVSNTFELEWPPGSGQMRSFPEIDKVGWFTAEVARDKLIRGQQPLVDRLIQVLGTAT